MLSTLAAGFRSFTPLIEVAFGRMSFHGKKYFDTGEIRAGRSVAGAARLGCFLTWLTFSD